MNLFDRFRLRSTIVWTMAILAISGCYEETTITPAPTRVGCVGGLLYTIKKGEHYAEDTFLRVEPLLKSGIRFQACFDESVIYDFKDSNQPDINKLYGFTDCVSLPQTNSARVGWRWNAQKAKIELFAYTHVQSPDHTSYYMTSISPGEVIEFQIVVLRNGNYLFRIFENGTDVEKMRLEAPRGCSYPLAGSRLFPYFGGNRTAPQDVKIWINEI